MSAWLLIPTVRAVQCASAAAGRGSNASRQRARVTRNRAQHP
jgi:hypothetical protein